MVGITAPGSGAAVLYNGPLLQALLDAFGWRNTFRIMTATFALVCILSLNFNPNVVESTSEVDVESETLDVEQKLRIKGRITFYCSIWTFPAYTLWWLLKRLEVLACSFQSSIWLVYSFHSMANSFVTQKRNKYLLNVSIWAKVYIQENLHFVWVLENVCMRAARSC